MSKEMMDLLMVAGIVCFGVYEFYKATRNFYAYTNTKKDFLLNNKDNLIVYKDYSIWIIIYGLVAIASLVVALMRLGVSDYLYAAGFAFAGVFAFSFALDAIVKRSAYFVESGFFYEKKFHKYRSVLKVEARNAIIPSYNLLMSDTSKIVITRKMGVMLEENMKRFKKRKK